LIALKCAPTSNSLSLLFKDTLSFIKTLTLKTHATAGFFVSDKIVVRNGDEIKHDSTKIHIRKMPACHKNIFY